VAWCAAKLDGSSWKCLEKDRSRRYDAEGLARDLRHHLSNEPVDACPPSASYRLRKLASSIAGCSRPRRDFVLVVAAAAVATVARRAPSKAEARREQAEIAEQINGFFCRTISSPARAETPSDHDLKLRTVLDRASKRVEDRFKDRPLVEAGLDNTMGIAFIRWEVRLRRSTSSAPSPPMDRCAAREPRHRRGADEPGGRAVPPGPPR
jgi:hypothetical protein